MLSNSNLLLRISIVCIVILVKTASSNNLGKECTSDRCTQEHGYIRYTGSSNIKKWTLSKDDQYVYTTFVIIIKNIQVSDMESKWLEIYRSYPYPNIYEINGTKNEMFILQNTQIVEIAILEKNLLHLEFEIEFYMGCKVEESDKISVTLPEKQQWVPGYQTPTPTTCWFIIPTIKEKVQLQRNSLMQWYYLNFLYSKFPKPYDYKEVQQTYLSLQDISLNNNLTVTNVLTGTTLMSAFGKMDMQMSVLAKSNQTITIYNEDRQVSTLVLMKLSCSNGQCLKNNLTFQANALQQKDLDCMAKERKCRFNIGKKNYSCQTPPPNLPPPVLLERQTNYVSHCPAFQEIFSVMLDSGIQERGHCAINYNKICTKGCKDMKKWCFRKCMYLRYTVNVCGLSNLFSK